MGKEAGKGGRQPLDCLLNPPVPFFWGEDMVFVMGEMHNEDSK